MSPHGILGRARATVLRLVADGASLVTRPLGLVVLAREDAHELARRMVSAERTLEEYEREILGEIERSQGTCSAARGIVG